ncbi:hypothetical protein DAPPUDRAFT_257053 [Daphnia pulex]|uniref:Uncharacterized protein n=1 Tax=Daphnia pulex TaxID=6669 RepID=E9HCQ2_DAPPU|nr:hypothetical protein DAPPUDRAFT_257053 [Daphnia pulex]|eukprot:EFX70478.1 hypothetical protein DAPPUDRAFT_257053 [Daphnia pulex]
MGLPDPYLEGEGSVCGCVQCFREEEGTSDKVDEEMKDWCRWTVRNRRQTNQGGHGVLQVFVQPGSYKVRRATSPLNGPAPTIPTANTVLGSVTCSPDPTHQQQLLNPPADTTAITDKDPAILWYTKERGAAIVQALLIRLDETASALT